MIQYIPVKTTFSRAWADQEYAFARQDLYRALHKGIGSWDSASARREEALNLVLASRKYKKIGN